MDLGSLERDLAVARDMVLAGWSCAVAKDGVVIDSEKGRGVMPVLAIAKRLRKVEITALADRVLGLAAFKAGALMGARVMWGQMASALAVYEGYKRGIPVLFHTLVPAVLNDLGNGLCPMEHLAFLSSEDVNFERAFWEVAEKRRK